MNQPTVRDRLAGVWRLLTCERKFDDGRTEYPYGAQPVGRLIYDKAGRMSAQLMRPGRRSTLPAGSSLVSGIASPEELRETISGFTAYFGTFDVDQSSHTVIHHVEAALIPSWVGADLRRTYRFTADRLHLTAAARGSTLELVWERQPD